MDEVQPDQARRRMPYETQQMMMIDPDDRDEQIAHRIADRGRPQRQQVCKACPLRRLEFQHHHRNDDRDHGIGKCAEPVCRHSLLSHRTLLWTIAAIVQPCEMARTASLMMSTTAAGAVTLGV